MAKRAAGLAEEASDLDVIETLTGQADHQTRGEEEQSPVAPQPNTGQLVLGAACAFAMVIGIMLVAKLLFAAPDTDYSMLPDGYREEVGLTDTDAPADDDALAAIGTDGEADLASAPRSPFPKAQTDDPVILEVDCPKGTVQIATGDNAADTVCVRGTLDEGGPASGTTSTPPIIVIAPTGEQSGTNGIAQPPASGQSDIDGIPPASVRPDGTTTDAEPCSEGATFNSDETECKWPDGTPDRGMQSTIGGTEVPDGLDCYEDETIWWTGIDTLDCVHYEIVVCDVIEGLAARVDTTILDGFMEEVCGAYTVAPTEPR